jgi:hypothetical protein
MSFEVSFDSWLSSCIPHEDSWAFLLYLLTRLWPLAQVTLIPLGVDNDVSRQFTLNNTDKTIIIGRSSKRGLKNRLPHQDNGWFDSRVMSRDHAELLIQPGKMVRSFPGARLPIMTIMLMCTTDPEYQRPRFDPRNMAEQQPIDLRGGDTITQRRYSTIWRGCRTR